MQGREEMKMIQKTAAQQVWYLVDFCSSNGNPTTSSRTSPGSLLELQTFRPHLRPAA